MGLLDYSNQPGVGMSNGLLDPRTRGLMDAGFAALEASGPSRMPVSLGQVVGRAGNAGLRGMDQGTAFNQDTQMKALQMFELQRQQGARDQAVQAQARFAASLPPNERVLFEADPAGYIKRRAENPYGKVDPQHYTPESVSIFNQTRDYSKLVPIQKAHFADTGSGIVPLNPVTGKPVGDTIPKGMSPDAEANLNFRRMEFNTLSENQRQQLAKEAERIGISRQQLAEGRVQVMQDGNGDVHIVNKITRTAAPATNASGGVLNIPKPLTESQAKANIFATRAAEADQVLSELDPNDKSENPLPLERRISTTGLATKRGMENVPLVGGALGMAGNRMLTGDQQKVEQAQRNFVNAALRVESGASISPAEFDNAVKQYFPQPGDSAIVIEQKRRNRQTEIEGLKTAATGRPQSTGTPDSDVEYWIQHYGKPKP